MLNNAIKLVRAALLVRIKSVPQAGTKETK